MTYSDQREAVLAAARKRTAARRSTFTKEERTAYLKYLSDYGKANLDSIRRRKRLWRAEQQLARALGLDDEDAIQKFRTKVAILKQIIEWPALW